MSLKERLSGDAKNALKSGERDRADVVRFLLSQVHNREIEKHGLGKGEELTDEEALQVLQKEAKRRREAIELFRKGGRDDLVAKEEKELSFLEAYLPQALSKDEIRAIVSEFLENGTREFNALMRETMKKVAGRGDGRIVSEVVREALE
ncbi:GatB/YqeY domain-containing protein [Candidatus Parcubacteria bacterium]|nr:MAG: GatB/YqeY domain-containing protein [Candidatus Parcubacteria bacterium]